jgi:hypothetical protein
MNGVKALGGFAFGWNDITKMYLKIIEPYVSYGFM